jgi:hypothetical protein
MHINDVRKYQAAKDHLMRNEGTHPANFDEYAHYRKQVYEDEQREASVHAANERDNDRWMAEIRKEEYNRGG